MTIERMILAIAGVFTLISLLLAVVFSYYWLWLTALMGANLLQAAFTGFCPMAKLLTKLGLKPGPAFK